MIDPRGKCKPKFHCLLLIDSYVVFMQFMINNLKLMFSKKVCVEFLKKMQHKLSSQLLAYMIFPYSPQAFRNDIRWLISHEIALISQDDKNLKIICT